MKQLIQFQLLCVALGFFLASYDAVQPIEVHALNSFKEAIFEDPSLVLSSWNSLDSDPCNWFGVTCSGNQVTKLNISGSSIKGFIAEELFQLSALQELILRENKLIGSIPMSIGSLKSLKVLDLGKNLLSSPIPSEIRNLVSIVHIELCKDLFKQWSNLDNSHFSAEKISGGITNLLLKVYVEEQNGNMVHVTVRLYGPNTEYVINRERELQALHHLSAAGFGPKLLGVFENGMVQSFLHARTLQPADMRKPKLAAEIAKQLNSFHQIDVPGSKEAQLWNDILLKLCVFKSLFVGAGGYILEFIKYNDASIETMKNRG